MIENHQNGFFGWQKTTKLRKDDRDAAHPREVDWPLAFG
jgi:hypothetical protein